MKIKNLIISLLSVLAIAIAQPAMSTLPYFCVYNWSGHSLALYPAKAMVCTSPPCYWACAGSPIGPIFPSTYSVRVTAGVPVYLCLEPPSDEPGMAAYVGNVSAEPTSHIDAGTTLVVTADPNNPNNYVQVSRVCTDPTSFNACMATGHASEQSLDVNQCACGPQGCG